MNETEKVVKPPLGVMPRYIWQELRVKDLRAAVQRYLDAGLTVPVEWVEEHDSLVAELRAREEGVG